MKTCKDCKFYDSELDHEGEKYAFCYRYPPLALSEGKSTYAVVRGKTRECGEFKLGPKTRK